MKIQFHVWEKFGTQSGLRVSTFPGFFPSGFYCCQELLGYWVYIKTSFFPAWQCESVFLLRILMLIFLQFLISKFFISSRGSAYPTHLVITASVLMSLKIHFLLILKFFEVFLTFVLVRVFRFIGRVLRLLFLQRTRGIWVSLVHAVLFNIIPFWVRFSGKKSC